MKIIKFIKDLIAPKKCYSCKKEWHFLCPQCVDKIWYFEDICYVCKQKSSNFNIHFYCKNDYIYYDKIIILFHYKNKYIKELIKQSKFHNKKDILEDFAYYMSKKLKANIDEDFWDLILIPTPMYFLKKIKRWYNQSEILVKNISNITNIDYSFDIIKKIKSSRPQSHLSKIERLENLKWVFSINNKKLEKYKNKTFIIVDDVVSSWATINEISKILKKSWIKKVYSICIASD